MAQNYTDDCFASGHVGQTDLQNMENNFACLKSNFSGAAAPSNTVAGMLWFDTTTNILKLRNELNSAWLEVYDFANSRVPDAEACSGITITAGTGLSGGGALSANRTISHAAHTGDVTGSSALTIGAAKVTRTMLKTSTGSASGSPSIPATDAVRYTDISMQDYCFAPNIYVSQSSPLYVSGVGGYGSSVADYTARLSVFCFNHSGVSGSYGYAARWRYVTSSDRPFVYIVRDPNTGDVIHCWECEDPPPEYWGLAKKPKGFRPPIENRERGKVVTPAEIGLEEVTLFDYPMDGLKELRERARHEKKDFARMLSRRFEIDPGKKIIRPINLSQV